ncbi:DNA ligase [Paenibacillus tianjinensis]|uniref:DNA ligase n=1 Tax=Paenibacillus tianjinensis TaxID=2810347 RepID=A0ABX7L4S2_9BACL|nr:DNA ligase [Paenibacillus tianjinensis]QSF42957.1 DNA ligase [Paenibacillus tianjinensis]
MNIGSLIRGLLGDSKPGEAKTLELKEGQVVRGQVLSVSDSGKEAVVQIQGTSVRAELETPLQPGQTMMLQVAPPGEGGLPVLKPVSLGDATLSSPQMMGEALESLGLTDSKAGKEIIRAILSGGLPLTKETAAKLDAVMNAKPQGVPTSEWLESAVISVKRGLPVTAESVKGIQQAVFGPKLHELLAKLETELGAWVQQEEDNSSGGIAITRTDKQVNTSGAGFAAGTGAAVDHASGNEAEAVRLAAAKGVGNASVTDVAAVDTKSAAQHVDIQLASARKSEQAAGATGIRTDDQEPEGAVVSGVPAEEESAGGGVLSKTGTGKEQPVTGSVAAGAQGNITGSAEAEGAGTAVKPATADAARTASAAGLQGNAAGSTGSEAAGTTAKPWAADAARVAGNLAPKETEGNAVKGAAPEAMGSAARPVAAEASGGALLAKLQGVLTELRGTLPQLTEQAAAPAQPAAGNAPPAAAGQVQAPAAGAPRGDNPAASAQPGGAPAPAQDTESWVGRVLKLLGAEHEQQAVRGGAPAAADVRTAAAPAAAGGREAALPQAALQPAIGEADAAADTLKGVLLQVMGSSDAPPAVKEAAGQLIQQLTGQQLLLNTDRTAPFAQVTLFLPLRGADGQETASVHIQSRRGRKGELDAANCRLWFDLDMKQLGQTMVDVQVVDRIVSLKLHNNDPWVLELLEERRDDVAAAVESIGYQLSSLRTEPLPEADVVSASAQTAAKLADYVPDSYKGVDYRI